MNNTAHICEECRILSEVRGMVVCRRRKVTAGLDTVVAHGDEMFSSGRVSVVSLRMA